MPLPQISAGTPFQQLTPKISCPISFLFSDTQMKASRLKMTKTSNLLRGYAFDLFSMNDHNIGSDTVKPHSSGSSDECCKLTRRKNVTRYRRGGNHETDIDEVHTGGCGERFHLCSDITVSHFSSAYNSSDANMKFGKDCVCLEGTHELNANDFELMTLLVTDDLRHGFPYKFMITCHCDQIFFEDPSDDQVMTEAPTENKTPTTRWKLTRNRARTLSTTVAAMKNEKSKQNSVSFQVLYWWNK
ncbi:hypothetical protein HNY73_007732 [Argiope bruennichi]|uniref:Uncharacterized protein n=1 Tax=Argiope bruennichi TaxID=94029 RepID=A0A8T0FHD5_ARGBR|nr:hypothetical protein HNY73_007732 [Argiope bruennichi]